MLIHYLVTRLKLNILDIERDSTKFIIHSGKIIFIINVLKIVLASGKIKKEHLFLCLTGFFGQLIEVLKVIGLFFAHDEEKLVLSKDLAHLFRYVFLKKRIR